MVGEFLEQGGQGLLQAGEQRLQVGRERAQGRQAGTEPPTERQELPRLAGGRILGPGA
jgi:hypothetical protein